MYVNSSKLRWSNKFPGDIKPVKNVIKEFVGKEMLCKSDVHNKLNINKRKQ